MTTKRQRGSGITPPRVVDLLNEEVNKASILAVHKATGIGLAAIVRYLKGEGEPTTASLQKLSESYGISVEWLRGSSVLDRNGRLLAEKQRAWCAECGNELDGSDEGFEKNTAGDIVGDRKLRYWPCRTCLMH